jgi:hypothetical protein
VSSAVIERGSTARQEFGVSEVRNQADIAIAAVAAREEAIIKAEYVMAERHPRVWMDVRAAMLDHCARPRFAEVSRYAKPVGKKKVNGEWVEEKAKGFSARFAETLAQEMGNVKPFSHVTYEDDLVRVVRFGVTDLQKNLPRSREVTFAKAVEKRGKKDHKTGDWAPPEGREVISQRINSYGDPVWLIKATDDEMRNKVNSEESKTQRDFMLRLCPRDILDECEDRIYATLSNTDKTDPTAALKRILDRFRELAGIMPSDIEQYIGKTAAKFGPGDLQELRELGAAIRDGQTTFNDALKVKYGSETDGGTVVGSAAAAAAVAEEKIAALEADAAGKNPPAPYIQDEGKPYTAETLPHPSSVKVDTECLYQDGDRLKHLRVVEEPGEAPKWVTVEEVNAHAQAAREEKPGLEPAASTAARPKFGRRG